MYKDMTKKDFLKMLGADEKILNNPSLDRFLSDVGISWEALSQKRNTGVISDDYEKKVTFYHDSHVFDNYETTVRVSSTGNVTVLQSFDQKLGDFEPAKTVKIGKILPDEKGITTRMFTAIGKKDEKEEGRTFTGQTEKKYNSNGVEIVRSYAEGPFVDSEHSNFLFDRASMDEWTVIRREPIGYIAAVVSEGKNKEAVNGYAELDMRHLSSLQGIGSLANFDNKSLTADGLDYTPNIATDEIKQEALNNMPNGVREYFEEAFKYTFKPEYLDGIQIDTLRSKTSKTR